MGNGCASHCARRFQFRRHVVIDKVFVQPVMNPGFASFFLKNPVDGAGVYYRVAGVVGKLLFVHDDLVFGDRRIKTWKFV